MDCKLTFSDYSKGFYEPSQKVKAEINLELTKPEKIENILCHLSGVAKCKWIEDQALSTGPLMTVRGHEELVKETFNVLDGQPVELEPGKHSFSISFQLPAELPTSFKCKNGSIKYKLRVTIERQSKNKNFEFPFTVIRPLNLNRESISLRSPQSEELSKNFKLDFTSEPLYVSASIPFGGYVPGQTINVTVQVNNQSKTNIREMKVSLKQIVNLSSLRPKSSKSIILPHVRVSTAAVPIKTILSFEEHILVPSLPPNISNCEVIQVSYELRVKAMTSGISFSRNPKLKIPIMIGTAPLESRGNIPRPLKFGISSDSSDAESDESSDNEDHIHFTPHYPVFEFE